MTSARCIVTVGVGERYLPYLARLVSSFRKRGEYADDLLYWADGWPPGSPTHGAMHYAFKYHAVQEAVRRGARYVVYLDSTCWAVRPVELLWKRLEETGYFLSTGDDVLGKWISDRALAHFGMTRDEAMAMKLPAGAIVGLDLKNKAAGEFLTQWGELAKSGLFWAVHSEQAPDKMTSLLYSDNPHAREVISADLRCWGHRSDEACFGPLMRKLGMVPTPVGTIFDGGVVKTEEGCIRCGYDLD